MNPHLSHSERRRVGEFWDAFARDHGYTDYAAIPAHLTPVDVIREEIESSSRALLNLFADNDWFMDDRVARVMKAAIDRDDLYACDILREILRPLIDAEVDKRAKAEGVGDYYDVDGVLAA